MYVGVVPLIVFSFWERLFSRGWLLLAWTLSIVLVGTVRFAVQRVILYLRRRDLFMARTFVVG